MISNVLIECWHTKRYTKSGIMEVELPFRPSANWWSVDNSEMTLVVRWFKRLAFLEDEGGVITSVVHVAYVLPDNTQSLCVGGHLEDVLDW